MQHLKDILEIFIQDPDGGHNEGSPDPESKEGWRQQYDRCHGALTLLDEALDNGTLGPQSTVEDLVFMLDHIIRVSETQYTLYATN